jgi:hypothetical protein
MYKCKIKKNKNRLATSTFRRFPPFPPPRFLSCLPGPRNTHFDAVCLGE